MPSPFPGMDPYLESWIWWGFHRSLICALSAQLNAKLPRHYVARLYAPPEDPLKRAATRIVNIVDKRVVTEIEVSYPPNRRSQDSTEAEPLEREGGIAHRLNFVEIDLLRSRPRPSVEAARLPAADYYILARRAKELQHLLVWPFSVRDRLPLIPIPVAPGLPEVMLDVRSAMDRVYEEGRYGEQVDYTKPPTPPLREPDASWACDLLASRPKPPLTA